MPQSILSVDDYLSLPREPEAFLLKPILPVGGSMLLYGDPKVGKSFAAIQLSLALSGALPDFLGFPVSTPGRVVYVQLDTPRSLWAARLEDLKREGLPVSALYVADRESLNTYPFDILNPDHRVLLGNALAAVNPTCVVVDTLREAHSGQENESDSMQPVIAHLAAVIAPAAMVLIAHSRKPGLTGGTDLINDNRGSSYITGRVDAICRMTKKGLYYTGRAVEDGSLKVRRLPNGLWEPILNDAYQSDVEAIIHDPSLADSSERARARALAEKAGLSLEAARSRLRRVDGSLTHRDGVGHAG